MGPGDGRAMSPEGRGQQFRAPTEQLLRQIAQRAGASDARQERVMLDETLAQAVDHFGLEALGVWLPVEHPVGYRRYHSIARGGGRLVDDVFLSSEVFDPGRFDEGGYVVVEASQAHEFFPGSGFIAGSSSLLVPLGDHATSDGFLGLPAVWAPTAEDWPDEVVTAARTIGHILGQTLSRIRSEKAVRQRSKVSRILTGAAATFGNASAVE